MKQRLTIGIRRYAHTLVIAEVLDELALSSAAATPEAAVCKLRRACVDVLERAHPRAIGRLGRLPVPEVFVEPLPVFTRYADSPAAADAGGRASRLEIPAHVLVRRFGTLIQTTSPMVHRSMWTRVSDPTTDDPKGGGIIRLADFLHRHDPGLSMHRPVADHYEIDQIEVEFNPADLADHPAEFRWVDGGAEVAADSSADDQTPTLEAIGRNWTLADSDRRVELGLVPCFGRDHTVEQLAELLFSARPAAVVVVGPDRVGKTSVIKHLAWLSGVDHSRTGHRRVWFCDPPRLTAADPASGGWQDQCGRLVDELQAAGDVLYLGRLVQALDAGKYVGSDYNLAQFLKPHLSDRRLRVVAEATVEEWSRIEQGDIGFAQAFNVVRLDDPAETSARGLASPEIVARAARTMGRADGVAIADDAIDRAWRLQKRFATAGSPVGRAIDFIGRTMRRAAQAFRQEVTEVDLVDRFCDETGLPPVMLLDDRTLDLDAVHRRLATRVMGQKEAVQRVVHVVGITKAGLAPADRPLGSFFFVGPTGVGKTELARALAEFLFGDEQRLIRLDMSEYSHPNAYARLIGEGRDDGELTSPVRRQPFSVILLDEVEKAHQSVYDLLLQVLGEARLTDSDGRTTRFQNTIVIMTSNLGVDTLRPAIGFGGNQDAAAWERHFREEAEQFFRPEFLARIDQFVPFRSLSEEVIEAIAGRELDKVCARDGLVGRDLEVAYDRDVVAWIAERGWDAQYGARPIKRVVEQHLAWPLARELAGVEQLEADSAYRVDISVEAAPEHDRLGFELRALDGQHTHRTRRALLAQVEHIADLRRRLERCRYGEIFAELEWLVHDFDTSSQAKGFWDLTDAAESARAAEHARELTEAVDELSRELAAIEDLVREAYHSRSFELTDDIDARVDEIGPRLEEVFLDLLRSAYQQPDRVVLFLPATNPQDPWRKQLVRWYRQLAGRRGWSLAMRRAVPRRERPYEPDVSPAQRGEVLWEHARKASGTVLALEFDGHCARALLQGEDGLHRKIAEDGNAHIEVFVLTHGVDWPKPSDLEGERPTRPTARTWNFRTDQVSMRGYDGLPIDTEYPWDELWPTLEDVAWQLAGSDW